MDLLFLPRPPNLDPRRACRAPRLQRSDETITSLPPIVCVDLHCTRIVHHINRGISVRITTRHPLSILCCCRQQINDLSFTGILFDSIRAETNLGNVDT
jgi:hypothetical protein